MRLLFVLFVVLLCVPFVVADGLEIVCVESGGNPVTLPIRVNDDNPLHYQVQGAVNQKYTCGGGFFC